MVHFVPFQKEITREKYIYLLINHIFKLHGLPEANISDYGPMFFSGF